MIPKSLHAFWTPPDNSTSDLPPDIKENVQSWHRHQPDFSIKTWTLAEIDDLDDVFGINVLSAMNICRFIAMKSDLIRLVLIARHGGFWSDLKNHFIEEVFSNTIVESDLFLVEHWPTEEMPTPDNYYCNSLIGCKPGNDFILAALEDACTSIHRRSRDGGVFGVTGGRLISRTVARRFPDGLPDRVSKLSWDKLWDIKVSRSGGSYNSTGRHWAERQKLEDIYLS